MGYEHLKQHQWKPGESGNPSGRPKGRGLVDRLKAILEEDDAKVADALIRAGVKAALKGDYRFWAAILDRVEGPVRQEIAAEIRKIEVEYRRRPLPGTEDTEGNGAPEAPEPSPAG